MSTQPLGTPRNPLTVRTMDGDLTPRAILLRVALVVLVGFLASRSQRAGSSPDALTAARMRVAKFGQTVGDTLTTAGLRLSVASSKAYESARS